MSPAGLSKVEVRRVKDHVSKHPMTVAVVRTDRAPSEITRLVRSLASACGLRVRRTVSSASSEFGIAELNSEHKMLIVLHVGGKGTELVSVSEADEAFLRDVEDSIFASNYHSGIIRDGL
ncbi:MAG: hypothetical protein A3K67_03680 [Euryarchaeota archaeon RBG_16_62_10]|nr:MAG: hypothetical protein A3K67_03680 [Euryarchaeota archaeon RBG_16_62_10]